jgi:hypothetical protein
MSGGKEMMHDKKKEAEYQKQYRKDNKEKLAIYYKEWHNTNKDKVKQYQEDNKETISKKQKEYREKYPEKIKQLWKDWYQLNPKKSPKRRFSEAKKTAKKRKILWSLTFEEYSKLIKLSCDYCDNKLGLVVGRSTGLDRIDNSKGYEIDNVVSCCYPCNAIKHLFISYAEMKIIAKTLISLREAIYPMPLERQE